MFEVGDYTILCQIGKGTFASVYAGVHSVTRQRVSIKAIRIRDNPDFKQEMVDEEIRLLQSIDHPFIACLYEVIRNENYYYIIMEFCGNGSLLEYINGQNKMTPEFVRKIIIEIAMALDYLHKEKLIAHRDLKLENVMLSDDFDIKLIDFGLSKVYTKENPILSTFCGSPYYASPEVLNQKPYTIKNDIWSLGVILYALVNGKLPFQDINLTNVFHMVMYDDPAYPDGTPSEIVELINRLLDKDQNTRISLEEFFETEWIKSSQEFIKLQSIKIQMKRFLLGNPEFLDLIVEKQLKILGLNEDQMHNPENKEERSALFKIYKRAMQNDEIIKLLNPEITGWRSGQNIRAKSDPHRTTISNQLRSATKSAPKCGINNYIKKPLVKQTTARLINFDKKAFSFL